MLWLVVLCKNYGLKKLTLITFFFLDINECRRQTDRCDSKATCRNTVGNYTCTCRKGYTGDGYSCIGLEKIFLKKHYFRLTIFFVIFYKYGNLPNPIDTYFLTI